MFSRYSPKTLLASYLSKSLAEFFCVDPERVKTNLVYDATVCLNDIEIKERRLGDLLVSGSVNQIEFTWTWSTASFITDATLTIKGVSIHVNIVNDDDDDDGKNNSNKETLLPISTSNNAVEVDGESTMAPDWKAKYLQQIIDNLTLLVTDVTVSIHLNEASKVVVQGTNMELRTLKNEQIAHDKNTLSQNISLASIEAWMETNNEDSSKKYPILEPFGYQASIQRISGRRFLDGILSGLFVQGKSWRDGDSSHACSSIRVHAGIQQISGLNRLQQVLLSIGPQDTMIATDSSCTEHEMLLDGVESGDKTIIPSDMDIASVFCLPFESMEVVLENSTTLRLTRCSIRYCTDGSELLVDCIGGVWVDDLPLSQNNRWILDLVSSELVLDSLQSVSLAHSMIPPIPHRKDPKDDTFYDAQSRSTSESSIVTNIQSISESFRLDLSLEMFKKLYLGIQAILPQYEEAMIVIEGETEQQFQATSSTFQSRPWTIRSNGLVSFRFTGSSDTWVEVSTNFPTLTQGDYGSSIPFSFDCSSIEINSNAGFSIKVPQIQTVNGILVAKDRVTATFESTETLTILQELWSQVTDIIGNASSGSKDVPVDISFLGIDICMKKSTSSSTVKMTGIRGSGIVWNLDLLQVESVGDVSSEAHFLEVTLDDDKVTMFLKNITNFSYKNIDYLIAPMVDTRLVFENDTVLLACKYVSIDYPVQTIDLQNKHTATAPKSDVAVFPLSIRFTAEHLLAGSKEISINAKGIDVWARPVESSVNLKFKSIKGSVADKIELSCGMVKGSLKFHTCDTEFDSSLPFVVIPGLGKLSTGTATIHNIVDLSIAKVGHLAKEIDVCSIALDESMATVSCNKILFCCPSVDGEDTQNNGDTSTSFNLPLCFEIQRLVLMPDYGLGKPGLRFDGLHVDLVPHKEPITINASCNYVQGRGSDIADFKVKKVRLSLALNLSVVTFPSNGLIKDGKCDLTPSLMFPGIEYIQKASLNIGELSEFNVAGKGRLCQPLKNSTISYEGGVLSADLECVYLKRSTLKENPGSKNEDLIAAGSMDSLDLLVELTAKRIIVVPDEDRGGSGLSLTEINVTVKPPRDGVKGSIGVVCKSLKAINSTTNTGLANGIKAKICLGKIYPDATKSIVIPACGIVSEAVINIASISEIDIPGVGKISREIVDTTVVFSNDCFKLNFGRVKWNSISVDKPSLSNSSDKIMVDCSIYNYPIEVVVQSLEIKDESSSALLCCRELNASLHRDFFDASIRLTMKMGSLSGKGYKGASITTIGISLTASISQTTTDEVTVPELISIPGIGNISSAILTFSEVSNLNVPNLVYLKNPVRSPTFRLEKGSITFDCPEICVHRSTVKWAPENKVQSHSPFDLPCKINISIRSFQVIELLLHNESQREMKCTSLNLTLEPVFARLGSASKSPGAGVYFNCNDFKSIEDSTAIYIPSLSASGLIQFDELSKIGNLVVAIDKAMLAADFSSVDWTGSLEKAPSTIMELPFTVLSKFELTLEYVGTLVNIENATIACETFEGNTRTTLDSIGAHYVAIVKKRIPYLLAKMNIVGVNLGDGVGMMAGKYLMNTSVVGATLGVASRDAVGSVLTQGKASRGVASSERYRFGDLSRGLVSSVKSAAKSGAQMRGDNIYQVGDVTATATKAAGKYTSENRVRLAGAGGSTVGMIAGAALLGPVGFIAGSFLGASAAQSTMTAATGDPKKKKLEDSKKSQRSVTSINNPHHALSTQPVDLLSSSNQLLPSNHTNQVPNVLNNPSTITTFAPAANVEAELVGAVATSDYRVVMVQAQVVDPPSYSLAEPTYHHTQQLYTRSQNSSQDIMSQTGTMVHPLAQTQSIQQNTQTDAVQQRQAQIRVSRNHLNSTAPRTDSTSSTSLNSANNRSSDQQYRFGDITRNIVAKGRQVDGREENSGYKFGDFTRGLFR